MNKLAPYLTDIAWFVGLALIVAGVALQSGVPWALITAGAGVWLPLAVGLLRRSS